MTAGEAGPLLLLAAQVRRSRDALGRLDAEVQGAAAEVRREPGGPWRAALALALDRLYSALEDAVLHALRAVDGATPSGESWHRALLGQAAISVPGLRPPILNAAALHPAERLLSFRHFLRHASLVELDPVQLLARADDAGQLAAAAAEDLEAFTAFIETSARS